MDANPVSILNRMEMVPLYQKEEEKLVALLEDLNPICHGMSARMGSHGGGSN